MKLPSRPPASPKHTEERLKLAASGLQALALTVFATIVIAPLLNAAMAVPTWVGLLGFGFAGSAEVSAFLLLRYIPPPDAKGPIP